MTGVLLLMKIGWRNLWRNPGGTLLTALALGLGLTFVLVSLGLLDGSHEQMVRNRVRFGTGHVVIQADGYQRAGSPELLMPAEIVSKVEAHLRLDSSKHPARGASRRLLASGLLTSATNSDGVRIMGIVPPEERAVSLIPDRMIEGRYLADDQRSGIVVGDQLARKLGVKVGGRVVLMVQALNPPGTGATDADKGEMQSVLLRVSGIFRTGVQAVDAHVVQMPLLEAQTLLGVPGRITQVALLLEREGDSPSVAARLRTHLAGAAVEILSWRESMPSLAQIFLLEEGFNLVMNGVVLVMVGLGILNTILMRVLQRRYEFGLCLALGLRPGQLAVIVIGESLALTAISLVLGSVIGLAAEYYLATWGLDLRWFFQSSRPAALVFDPILYSRLSPSRTLSSVGIVFLTSVAISLYPAFKAARTDLAGALKLT